MKLVYVHEDGQQELVTYFASNYSVSIEQVLEQTNTCMNEWCEQRGYEDYDFNALELVESDNIQLSLEYKDATPQDAIEIREWIKFLIEENKQQQDILGWDDLEILTRNNIVIAKAKRTSDSDKCYELSIRGYDVILIQDFKGEIREYIFD